MTTIYNYKKKDGTTRNITVDPSKIEEFTPAEDASKGQITQAFKRFSKSKKLNKTLLTNFGKAVAEWKKCNYFHKKGVHSQRTVV